MEEDTQNERFLRLWSGSETEIRRYVLTLLPDRGAADDVMQETSVALWKKFSEYELDRPFLNWACRFAYYEVLKHRKRQQVQTRHFCQATIEALAEERLEEQDALIARRKALAVCLEDLSQADRDLVGLRYATGATIADLAREIEQPAKRLYRALERIRRALLQCVTRRVALEEES